MSTPNITRADAIHMLTTNENFMASLKDLKAADGYTPEELTFIDDLRPKERICTGVIATMLLKPDGTPIPSEQSGAPTMWVEVDWMFPCAEKPLYVHEDGKIHYASMSRANFGYSVRPCHHIFSSEKEVHVYQAHHGIGLAQYEAREGSGLAQYEAHIHLTVPELASI